MKKLFLMLPCYNEEKDIIPLVEKCNSYVEQTKEAGYEMGIYCVDDKSIDQTNEIIRKLVQRYPQTVHLIEHKKNKGLGGVLQTCFRYFYSNGTKDDLLVIMDGDNTHDPCYILSMLQEIKKGYDCVIASRYCYSSQTKGVPPLRLFLSWGARMYYTVILGVKNVKDYTCGYRMYTYKMIDQAIHKYGSKFVEHRSFACMMEVLYKLYLLEAKFQEVPFELRYDNKKGVSKMKLAKTISESLLTALKLRLNKKKLMVLGKD